MKIFENWDVFEKIINLKNKDQLKLNHSNDYFNMHLIVEHFNKKGDTLFVVLPNLYEAQKYYDGISQLINIENILFYPTDSMLTTMMSISSSEFRSERLFTLKQLLTNKKFIVIMSYQGLLQKQLSPIDYKNSVKVVKKGDVIDKEKIISFLISGGYQKSYQVEYPGTFSVRGHIIDVFTLHEPNPFRIDFFDNEIDIIKKFDVNTQTSIEEVGEIEISPMNELFFTSEMKKMFYKNINKAFNMDDLSIKEKDKLMTDLNKIESKHKLDTLNYYIQFFQNKQHTILDFAKGYSIYLIDKHKMITNNEQSKEDLEAFKVSLNGDKFLKYSMYEEFNFITNVYNISIDNYGLLDKDISINTSDVEDLSSNFGLLFIKYKEEIDSYHVFIDLKNDDQINDFKDYLNNRDVRYNETDNYIIGINIVKNKFAGSFISRRLKMLVINEEVLFGYLTKKKAQYRSVLNQATKVKHTNELNIGDYIVHYSYGIGRFMGLKTMELSSNKRDYLEIQYLNNETLYVPVDQLDQILKYSSSDGASPKLSRLGGKQWTKTKAKVRQKIKEFSDRLIKLYSERQQSLGYRYNEDTKDQLLFERDFEYQLTKDQEVAIIQTKADMESNVPMDRLICGDVGFGKTEVALRASFKAVMDGKQVMYLVPTTILARQHYYTFKERFDKYGGNVSLLSRFVSTKQQKETLRKLEKGLVDVVIGTHRLLSKDVKLRDLGLLIIDEEQRFGVEHKERIKEIKVNVDTLTLTATPIPRTLQMSLLGLKELSMIETPPQNRYPVQTYVIEQQDALIKEAIRKEIARGGQVFYLFNRVMSIEFVVHKLQTLVPEAKIAFAHGKMTKNQLEKVLTLFTEKKFDVLVATTIIETGIDIPNVNTLIVEDADRLGLSQLYQIRGRVGRSDRIAYAYLMYKSYDLINEESKKRLLAIQDFTALGSGYNIALRDLAIRGAGDMLGSEQSGFIDSVGIELYTKLLEEQILDKPIDDQKPKDDEIYAQRHVSKDYVDDDRIRIEIHQRISRLNSLEEVDKFKEDLIDRFGHFDQELVIYMYEKLFKKLSYKVGIESTNKIYNKVKLVIREDKSKEINGQKLFRLASKYKNDVELGYIDNKVTISIKVDDNKEHWLYKTSLFLNDYLEG